MSTLSDTTQEEEKDGLSFVPFAAGIRVPMQEVTSDDQDNETIEYKTIAVPYPDPSGDREDDILLSKPTEQEIQRRIEFFKDVQIEGRWDQDIVRRVAKEDKDRDEEEKKANCVIPIQQESFTSSHEPLRSTGTHDSLGPVIRPWIKPRPSGPTSGPF